MSDADRTDWPHIRPLSVSEDYYLNWRYPVESYRWVGGVLVRIEETQSDYPG